VKAARGAAALGLGAWLLAWGARAGAPQTARPPSPPPGDWFVDAAPSADLRFVHRSGRAGEFYFPEISGAGAGVVDYDNDGDLDVYVVQSGRLKAPGDATGRSSEPRTGEDADRLYRNDLAGPGQALHFTDATARSGIATRGYGQGVAAGDYDNDGFADLYVTSFGPNQLLRNRGDGTFQDVTGPARADDPRWSSSASFADLDRDGWLDLYVANYVDFSFRTHKACRSRAGKKDYCGPLSFQPLPHRLLRNAGNGSFEDVSLRAGIVKSPRSGLGVVAADFDGDAWPDVYVANDQMENLLWVNGRDGTFRDAALAAGVALSAAGTPQAGMGVDAADFDNDGDEDVFLTHLTGEYTTLYVNEGSLQFSDKSLLAGVAGPSRTMTGFGAAWLDVDNDGWLDMLTVNGTVSAIEALVSAGDPFPYHQPKQLFMSNGDGTFRDASREAGAALAVSDVGRGAAFGDLDNDGDTDVVITQIDGPARVLLNQVGSRRHWLGVRLVTGKRDALGAVAVLRREGERTLRRRARSDGSYLSANDPRVLFGLGQSARPGVLEVRWPDGRRERFRDLGVDRYVTVRQGQGERIR
jgi:hypothetical protein